jgi:hypothetical protein
VQELLTEEFRCWFWAALAEQPTTDTDVVEVGVIEQLSDDERHLIEVMDQHNQLSAAFFAQKLGDTTTSRERAELIRDELSKLEAQYNTLLEEAIREIEGDVWQSSAPGSATPPEP